VPSTTDLNPAAQNGPSVAALVSQVETDIATVQQMRTQVFTTIVQEVQTIDANALAFLAATNPAIAAWLQSTTNSSPTSPSDGGTSGSDAMSTDQVASPPASLAPAASSLVSPNDDPGGDDPSGPVTFDATLGGNVGSTITLSGSLSGGVSGTFTAGFSGTSFTISGSLSDGSTFSIDNGTYTLNTSGNGFNGTLTFSGTSSDGTAISGSGTFSGSADSNDNFNGILNLQVTLSGESLNGYANYSGSVDDSGNVSGSLDGRLATPFTIYNTGVDDNGTPLADGSVDPHYTITAAPSPYSPGSAYAVDQTSYPFSPHDYWLPDGDGLSSWIGPVADETNDPSGTYTYETTFDLTGYDASTAVITGQDQSDNWLSEIILNGQVVANFSSNGASNFALWQALPEISSGFVSGENTLEFVTSNYVQATGNPTGFRVELQGSAALQPTVTNPGDQTNAEGDNVSLQMQASGGSGTLYYGASNLPAGLSIDITTGLISGTLDYSDAQTQDGLYSVTVTATDSNGESGSTTFNWSVTNTDTPPTLDNPGDLTNWQGDAVALQLSASDPDGDTLTYSATGLPSGLTLNSSTGFIFGVLAAPDGASSPYSVTVGASDGTNTVYQSFTWTVATVNIDAVADQSNLIGDSVSLPINAWDQSGQSLTYSATGLPPGLSIDSSSGVISGTIADSASVTTPYNVTVTATDGTDPASTTFAWNISNFTLDNPGDQTNVEGDAVALQPTVETNGNPTLTFSATGLPSGLSINPNTGLIAGTVANLDSNNSPYTVTISATDGTSTSSQTFTWTVTYITITDPGDQINAPGDTVSLPIQASDPANDTLSYSATGLPPGLSIDATTGLISGTIDSTAGSDTPYSVTVTVSDGTHTASDNFNWTVANQAVTVTNPGTQDNAEGDNVSLQINASDPDGNPLSFTATGLPPGLEIDYASGLISGTVDTGDAASNGGVYQVTVLADDGQGDNGSTTFTWNISATNLAPTLFNPGDQTDPAGDVVSLPLFGYDDDGDTVTYSATGLPPGLSLDANSGIISGTLAAAAAASTPCSVTVTASDGTLTAQQTFNWFVTSGVVTLTSPGDQTNTEGDNVSLQLSASDANNSTLTYQASGLPDGLSIDSSTGLISGTIASGDAANGPYFVTITAADSNGYSAGQQFLWNVNPANLDPVVTNPGSQINTQGDVLTLQISATDPAGNGLSYSATGLPPGLTIDSDSGLISGVLSDNSASESPYTVTVTATDGSNSGSTTFNWSVTNQNVTVTNPGTQSNTGGDTVSLQISASDPDGDTLTYSAVGMPEGLSIDASSGLISGAIDSSVGGAFSVTVMASDSQGNSGSTVFTWNVKYLNQAPTLANPGDQLNQTGDVVSVQLYGSDVDGDTVTYSATGLPSGLSIDSNTGIISGTLPSSASSSTPYSVTVTASDGTLTAQQTFNWFVTAGVVTLTNPGDQTNNEGDNVSLQLSASDANNSTLTYQASGLPDGLSIDSTSGLISGTIASGDSANGPYTVTVSASDSQGYSASQQFTWNVNVPANSLTLTNPGNQSNAEGDNVSLQVQASDSDGDFLEYAASGLPIGLWIDPNTGLIQGTVDYSAAEISNGLYNVTVTVNDGNGDTASQSFVWTIANTEQGPWLASPGMQSNEIGNQVSLQLYGGSPDGNPLTYSATGLPAGLGIDATTGLISGTVQGPNQSYSVTVSVTDNILTAQQTFTWQVGQPTVILAINGSVDPSGDVLLVNSSPNTTPLTITLENASPGILHLVQISIPSGFTEVSQSQLELYNGESTTVWLTPVQGSQSADDVDIQASVDGFLAADKQETNEKVTFANNGNIRYGDTPSGMADRIPPSKDAAVKTTVSFTLSTDLGAGETLFLNLYGDADDSPNNTDRDPNAGLAWLVVGSSIRVRTLTYTGTKKGTYTDEIWGETQTDPGHAGEIHLDFEVARNDKNKVISAGFSVDAIPDIVTEAAWNPKTYNKGNLAGLALKVIFHSDSLQPDDLDKHISVLEKIQDESLSGSWKDNPPKLVAQKGYVKVEDTQNYQDLVALPIVPMIVKPLLDNKTSDAIVVQAWIFKDTITGASDLPIAESGFERIYSDTKPKQGEFWKYLVSNQAAGLKGLKLGIDVSAGQPADKLEQSFHVKLDGRNSITFGPD